MILKLENEKEAEIQLSKSITRENVFFLTVYKVHDADSVFATPDRLTVEITKEELLQLMEGIE